MIHGRVSAIDVVNPDFPHVLTQPERLRRRWPAADEVQSIGFGLPTIKELALRNATLQLVEVRRGEIKWAGRLAARDQHRRDKQQRSHGPTSRPMLHAVNVEGTPEVTARVRGG